MWSVLFFIIIIVIKLEELDENEPEKEDLKYE